MIQYTELTECCVDGEDEPYYILRLKVGVQHFSCSDAMPLEDAEWMQKMLIKALDKINQDAIAEKDARIKELEKALQEINICGKECIGGESSRKGCRKTNRS